MLLDDPALALPGVERLAELDLLGILHPGITLDERSRERLRGAPEAWDWYHRQGPPPVKIWMLHLMALASDLDKPGLEQLADRLLLTGEDRRLLTAFPERLEEARSVLVRDPAPHEVTEALEALEEEELLLLLGDESTRSWVQRFLTELRGVSLGVRGADLLAAGVPAGPWIGRALRETHRARLDGRIGMAEELVYALDAAQRHRT